MKKTSKIYVAGHNGMVGSAIKRALLNRGYRNLLYTPFPPYDLTDQQTVTDFFNKEKPEYVFMAAAKVGGILANNTYRAQFIYDNLMIQNNIIHQCYVSGVKKMLFLGSSCVYPRDCLQPIKESYLLSSELENTNEPYAIAKIAGIKMCESYNIQYGTNYISVMPTNMFGPNDNYNLETSHLLPALIRKIHLGKCLEKNDWTSIRKDLNKFPIEGISGESKKEQIVKILSKYGITYYTDNNSDNIIKDVVVTLWGTGSPFREFLYVDDTVDACIYIMEHINIEDIISLNINKNSNEPHIPVNYKNTHINIGSGNDQTISELAETVKEIVGFTGSIKWDSSKPDGTFRKLLDVSNLRKLGWYQKISIKEGIEMVYHEYKK